MKFCNVYTDGVFYKVVLRLLFWFLILFMGILTQKLKFNWGPQILGFVYVYVYIYIYMYNK